MENLQNEYGNTIEQGLCVVKYFVLQSRGTVLLPRGATSDIIGVV